MWWDRYTAGQALQVVALQVDLAGHSAAVVKAGNDKLVARSLAEFAQVLSLRLAYDAGFDLVFWAGDGGLFTRLGQDRDAADRACDAANSAFDWFHQWRTHEWQNDLELRVSATYLSKVIFNPGIGFWYGPKLSEFLKHERDISARGAFVVTQDLKQEMSPSQQSQFQTPRSVGLEGSTIVVWTDSRHRETIRESTERFGPWLSSAAAAGRYCLTVEQFGDQAAPRIDDALVIYTAIETSGYPRVAMTPIDAEWDATSVDAKDRERFYAAQLDLLAQYYPELISRGSGDPTTTRDEHELIIGLGTKASIVSVSSAESDDPSFHVRWKRIPFVSLRTFESLLSDDALRARYRREAERVLDARDGTRIGNSICMHVVVLVSDGADKWDVVLAHRRQGGRTGSLHDTKWSAAFEENFNPAERTDQKRRYSNDGSVEDTVLRGLREELVGEDYTGRTDVSVHAFFMEPSLISFGFLALVRLPELTFAELADRWSAGKPVDKSEHDVIARIPLDVGVLNECLGSDRLPATLWGAMRGAGRADLKDTEHRWHPTARMRLALALWYAEALGKPKERRADGRKI